MRVLIVGAGIAGLSLAAMLRLRGIDPILIEKAFSDQDGGYVSVWPMGTHVLHGLNRLLRRNGRHTPCAVLRHGPGKCASYIVLRYNKQAPRGQRYRNTIHLTE